MSAKDRFEARTIRVAITTHPVTHREGALNQRVNSFDGTPKPYDAIAAIVIQKKANHYVDLGTHPADMKQTSLLRAVLEASVCQKSADIYAVEPTFGLP